MKTGLITFHNSYNCGSMLQTYALFNILKRMGCEVEVIDFSNEGQRNVYSVFYKNNTVKNIVKNMLISLCSSKISHDFARYEEFKNKHFVLSKKCFTDSSQLTDDSYDTVITGSDQVWNITIEDGDDAYFLPWVTNARKIAYAPSFGARNIMEHAKSPKRYAEYLKSFHSLSIRENNGKTWIKELANLDVPVIIDPTLLLSRTDYDKITSNELDLPEKYIFYYSPGYSKDINQLVESISKKYNLPVIAFNAKHFYINRMFLSKMRLPKFEDPSTYLQLIKNATMVITTSFHGTIFSSIYNKCFWVVKNGMMFIKDDRVPTLVQSLDLMDRVIKIQFDDNFDYLAPKDYTQYYKLLVAEQQKANNFLKQALK